MTCGFVVAGGGAGATGRPGTAGRQPGVITAGGVITEPRPAAPGPVDSNGPWVRLLRSELAGLGRRLYRPRG